MFTKNADIKSSTNINLKIAIDSEYKNQNQPVQNQAISKLDK